MKRFIAVIIAACYLCLSVGITVHLHYCMGKIVEVSLLEQHDDHYCSHCGMDKKSSKNDCCKDEYKIIKGTSDQAIFKDIVTKVQFSEYAQPIKPAIFTTNKILATYINRMAQTHAPPLIAQDCPLYIRVRNFRV